MQSAPPATSETLRLRGGEMTFAALAWGPPDGPLALCLHGYPDTAGTWRHLGPWLAERGWRVVAPYMRGYAPTDLAPDGAYQVGALSRDVIELRESLGGDARAVLIGHDWGAVAAYAAASRAPGAFRRVITLAVPPGPVFLLSLGSPKRLVRDFPLIARQLRCSWYMFFQLLPVLSERALPRLIPKLWDEWSPGYNAAQDVRDVLAALAPAGRKTAALRYYRALYLPWTRRRKYASEQRHVLDLPSCPLLYLHGEHDGCILPDLGRRARHVLAPPSRAEIIAGAGHFLHLERPDEVNRLIAEFVDELEPAAARS